jgi:hypothetical protein
MPTKADKLKMLRSILWDSIISALVFITGIIIPIFVLATAVGTQQYQLVPLIPCLILTALTHPGGWWLWEMLGIKYVFTKKYLSTAVVLSMHRTRDPDETRKVCEEYGASWSYAEWHFFGDRFLIMEFNHQGKTKRVACKVKANVFATLVPGAQVGISYQFARGPDGPRGPLRAQLSA